MAMLESYAWLAVLVGLFVALFWLGIRWTRRPPVPSELRRADEAQAQKPPTKEELQERISEAFGEMRGPDGV